MSLLEALKLTALSWSLAKKVYLAKLGTICGVLERPQAIINNRLSPCAEKTKMPEGSKLVLPSRCQKSATYIGPQTEWLLKIC